MIDKDIPPHCSPPYSGSLRPYPLPQTGSATIASDYTFGNAALGIPAVHLNSIAHSVNGTPLRTYAIGRTALGQVSTQTATDSSNNTMGSEAISYDLRGRVTGDTDHYQTNGTTAQYNSSNAYTWDLSNNLMGGASGWTYNTSNQATSASAPSGAPGLAGGTGLAYDASGNLTAMNGAGLSWDCWGNLAGAGSGAYTYDSAGRRVSKTVSGVTTYYLYVGGALIAELDSSGNLIRSYDWGPLGPISENSASGPRYYLFDGMGNTRFLLNAAGGVVSEAAYTAWGSTYSSGVIASPFAWKGQGGAFTDSETGLIKMGARYYAAAIGRFISRDPSGFAGGPNVYGFCGGDPVNFFDPTGCGQVGEDWFWQAARDASDYIDTMNEVCNSISDAIINPYGACPLNRLLFPKVTTNPIGTLVAAHDAFRDWGAAEGNKKGSPAALVQARWRAAGAFGMVALEYTGYASLTFEGALSAAAKPGCFVAGTLVQVATKGKDGKWHLIGMPIEKVRQGDLVPARDDNTGKTQFRRVLRTTVRKVNKVLTVSLADPKTHKVVENITASREHPFYVRGKGFVPAGGLAVGNAIVTRARPVLVVASIRWNRRAEGYTVYNFVVEDDHSYFVGRAGGGVWVHNPGPCGLSGDASLTGRDWMSMCLPEQAIYVLRDADTGELLKVGQSFVPLGRFKTYAGIGRRVGRNLAIEFEDVSADGIYDAESALRSELERMGHKLPWDNTGGRLGRPGPGTP